MKQNWFGVVLAIILLLVLTGCDKNQLKFEGNKVIETSNSMNEVTYGAISDLHGEVDRARTAAKLLKSRGVKGIIIAGDISCNEQLSNRCAKNTIDQTEIEQTLAAVAETGLPIFVIPGNHEEIPAYNQALLTVKAKFPNIIDMTQYRIFDGKVIDFMSLPGYSIKVSPIVYEDFEKNEIITTGLILLPRNGFYITPTDFRSAENMSKTLDRPLVLITHGPGKIEGNNTPGRISTNKDAGDERITTLMRDNNIPFAIVGHIHEAGGIATTLNGTNIKPGEWSTEMMLNVGTLQNWVYNDGTPRSGMIQMVTFRGNEAKYETITLE